MISKCNLLAFFVIASSFLTWTPAAAFVVPPQSKTRRTTSTTPLENSPLFSDKSEEPSDEFEGFNPFQPGAKIPTKGGFGILSSSSGSKAPSTPGGQISPRQMKMKEITVDLLNCISNPDSVGKLLESNEEFLLEQLNNDGAILDPDSVYHPSMTRSERFARYREVMDERLGSAKAPAAKNVLSALRDFVLSRE